MPKSLPIAQREPYDNLPWLSDANFKIMAISAAFCSAPSLKTDHQ